MARKQVVEFIDDLDGTVLEEFVTVRWALGDKQYEFDTSPHHADQFYKSLEKYLGVSRRATAVTRESTGSRESAHPKDRIAAIREWARNNGHQVNARGRIPAHIVEAFNAVH